MILKMCGDRAVEVDTMFIIHKYIIEGKNKIIISLHSDGTYKDYDGKPRSSYDEILNRVSARTKKKWNYEIINNKIVYSLNI